MEDNNEINDMVNNFNSESNYEQNEEEEEDNINMNQINQIFHYNPAEYENDYIINKLFELQILKKEPICEKCGGKMKLENDNQYLDKKVWRCRSKNPKHDVKRNIRVNSVYEIFNVPLFILYFLTFECFSLNKKINKSLIDVKDLCSQLGKPATTKRVIIKLFRTLREKLRIFMHKVWSNNPLGSEPAENGVPRIEIDESEIIGNQNNKIWMFGLIDRVDKEARVFCVMNDRTKENLLPIIERNVLTNDIGNNWNLKTRIYSDCYASYQPNDFEERGYILHRVNHSVWFGQGLFHTNTVEGLWSKIKRLSNNFSGITMNYVNELQNEGINIKNYFDGWICYSLFQRHIEKNYLSTAESKIYLIDILKIN